MKTLIRPVSSSIRQDSFYVEYTNYGAQQPVSLVGVERGQQFVVDLETNFHDKYYLPIMHSRSLLSGNPVESMEDVLLQKRVLFVPQSTRARFFRAAYAGNPDRVLRWDPAEYSLYGGVNHDVSEMFWAGDLIFARFRSTAEKGLEPLQENRDSEKSTFRDVLPEAAVVTVDFPLYFEGLEIYRSVRWHTLKPALLAMGKPVPSFVPREGLWGPPRDMSKKYAQPLTHPRLVSDDGTWTEE